MYTPREFQADDLARLHDLMRAHPFALFISVRDGELFTTHLPCLLDAGRGPQGTLEAHLARANPHAAVIAAGTPTTVVFRGPQAYVSPRWYAQPADNVPTWNYAAVEVSGTPRVVDGEAAVLGLIERLTREHEAYVDPPWTLDEGRAYATRIVRGVVAFELPIERLQGKFKFNQNKRPADRLGVMRALADSHPEVVALMQDLYDADGERR